MSLIRNFTATTYNPNSIKLTWDQPIGFNSSGEKIVIHRTITHFPMELYNSTYPNTVSENRGICIFSGKTEAPLEPADSSAVGELGSSSSSFPSGMGGRLLRDYGSNVYRIISSTTNKIYLDTENVPYTGVFVILPDFPTKIRKATNFEIDIRTTVGSLFIKDPVSVISGFLQVTKFEEDELVNLIFKDGANNRYIIKSNTVDTIFLYPNNAAPATPVIGPGMQILESYNNLEVSLPFIDLFKLESEVITNPPTGSGLQNNTFYYYTGFTYDDSLNVARAKYSSYKNTDSTQTTALSIEDKKFGDRLYSHWPMMYKLSDTNEDLHYLMRVFGFQFNEIYSLINTFKLQNTQKVFVSALVPLSDQMGLPTLGYTLGIDTLRRISTDMITAWKLKGTKEGIALFIKIITTWDITGGTADFDTAINDDPKNINAFRFYLPSLDPHNTRITQPSPFVEGGRFATTLPGIVIPGFFTFREFTVNIPNVALHLGVSSGITISGNTTIIEDTWADFGANDSLVSNFILPNQEEINDVFEIIGNTKTTITVSGIIKNKSIAGNYVVLSPLNTNRFLALNNLLPVYIPYKTKAGFIFV